MNTRGKVTVALGVLAAVAFGLRGGRLAGELAAERRRQRRNRGIL
jgi:hypothetical protein